MINMTTVICVSIIAGVVLIGWLALLAAVRWTK